MASIVVRLRIKSGAEGRFEQLARHAHASTHEHDAGLRRYEFWRGAQPSTYLVLEAFDDVASFVAHQRSAEHLELASELRDVIEDMTVEWIDPVPDAAGSFGPTVDASRDEDRRSRELPPWWASVDDQR